MLLIWDGVQRDVKEGDARQTRNDSTKARCQGIESKRKYSDSRAMHIVHAKFHETDTTPPTSHRSPITIQPRESPQLTHSVVTCT